MRHGRDGDYRRNISPHRATPPPRRQPFGMLMTLMLATG